MIETEQLTKRYGSRTAVDGITFQVPRGEVVGFLGPNGAGKSTTLKMLAGFIPPTAGTARIAGKDVVADSLEARKLIGYMPETVPLYPEMRVEEYLRFRAEIKGVAKGVKAAVERALDLADVKDVAKRLVGELSKGYKQRVGLADALVASPPLLILDEPTEGLDPNQILRVRDVVRSLGKDHTIFLSTHILSEVEAVCSHVVIIDKGKIATAGPLDTVRRELQGEHRAVALVARARPSADAAWSSDPLAAAARALGDIAGVTARAATTADGVVHLALDTPHDPAALEDVVAALVGAGLGVREVVPQVRSLERIFHELTAQPPATPTPGDKSP